MKKRSFILGACLCMALAVTGCGKSKSDNASEVQVALGQYKGVEVTLNSTEVTDEEVQQRVDAINSTYGTDVLVTDRTDVQKGDTVNIDYVGKVDGVAFDGGTATGSALKIGSNTFIEGFEDGLIGANVGDTLDVNATFPDPYTNNPDLAGKEAVFTVTVNAITTGEKEPITDEVVAKAAEAAGTDKYTTVAEYEEYVREALKSSKETSAQTQKEIDIIQKAIDNATFTNLAQTEIDEEATSMNDYYTSLATQYGVDLETYVYYMFSGMTTDQFTEQIKTAAEFNVKQRYLLKEVVKEENITLTDDEFNSMVEEYLADQSTYKTVDEFVAAYDGKDAVMESLQMEKALNLILDSAVVKEATEATDK